MLQLGGTAVLVACALLGHQASAADRPIVEKIEGPPAVSVLRAGKTLKIGAGKEVRNGDRVQTEDGQRATVAYPDGSRLSILPLSEVEILKREAGGGQPARLIAGRVRGVVVKAPSSGKPAKHRFTVRSRAAVMGVRGTDFVMSLFSGSTNATVHVVEGTVDVAGNAQALASGESTAVQAGNFVSAGPGGVTAPQPFNPSEFLDEIGYGEKKAPSSPEQDAAVPQAQPSASPAAEPSPAPSEAPKPEPVAKTEEAPKEPSKEAAKKEEDEEPSRSIRILSFQFGVLGIRDPNGREAVGWAPAWTPRIPVPFITPLWIRGQLGACFTKDKTADREFTFDDIGAFLSLQLFNRLLVEGGAVHQGWERFDLEGPAPTVNVGLVLMPNSLLHRLFVGKSWFKPGHQEFPEWRAGIGFQF